MANETTERKTEFVDRSLSIKSDTGNLSQVRDFIMQAVQDSPMPDPFSYKIMACVDEAVTNVIQHAYEYDVRGTVEIYINIDSKRCRIVIKDNGKNFDPVDIETPDIREHVRKGRTHGLGIFLMRRVMDKVEYDFVKGVRNELLLEKYF